MAKRSKPKLKNMQKFTICVICLSMLAVVTAAMLSIFLAPERTTKNLIASIAADYYENYYYAKIVEANPDATPETMKSILGKYDKVGLSAIPLTQLFLYDNQKHADAEAKIEEYCNINQTYVKIFPDPPYQKNSYHVEYTYSCNF